MQKEDYYHDLYELADQSYKEGQFEKSEQLAIETLIDNPKFGPAYQLLFALSTERGFEDEARVFQKYRVSKCISLPERIRKKYFNNYVNHSDENGLSLDNYSKVKLFNGERTKLSSVPSTIQSYSKYFRMAYLNSDSAYRYVVPKGKAWIDGFNQIIWDAEGNIIEELSRGHAELVDSIVSNRNPEKISGKVGVIVNRNFRNYYHWITDVVPSLSIVSQLENSPERLDHYISSPVMTGFQQETMERFNIPADKQLVHGRQTFIEADELIVASWGSNTMGANIGSWVSEELKKQFEYETDTNPQASKSRLYISRGNSETRRILNEPELVELLKNKYGFSIIEPSNHSMKEQAQLFSNADCIIATHGAALSNLHFCKKDTTVIELFGNYIDACFWILCNRIGLKHHFHQPECYRPEPDSTPLGLGVRRKQDLDIDIQALSRDLDLWL